ncbi:MAG: ElyC/SanA/YdcF family protein [Parcubacteria group bacterium]
MDIGIEKAEIKKQKPFIRILKKFVLLLFCSFVVLILIILRVQLKYKDRIIDGTNLTPPNAAMVFGAGLKAQGQPGDVLEDRIKTAIRLYRDGRVGKFVMSGDNSENHNEVQAMNNYALLNGLPAETIMVDDYGVSTIESCRRVKTVFGLNKIILITQKYHLRRALYLCNSLGVDAVGVAAEDRGYKDQWKFSLREMAASAQAWWQVKTRNNAK